MCICTFVCICVGAGKEVFVIHFFASSCLWAPCVFVFSSSFLSPHQFQEQKSSLKLTHHKPNNFTFIYQIGHEEVQFYLNIITLLINKKCIPTKFSLRMRLSVIF